MEYDLKTAYELGLVRQGVKNEVFPLFQRLRNTANQNTLDRARKAGIGSSFGIADEFTGLLAVHPNNADTLRELETVTSKTDIAKSIIGDYPVDPRTVAASPKFYTGQWFVINRSEKTSKPNWEEALQFNEEKLMPAELPDGTRVQGLPFGKPETGIKILFKIPKK
jgi:hypothetical protein